MIIVGLLFFLGLKASHPNIVLPEIDKERVLGHLDHANPNSFEVADLAKLIQKVRSLMCKRICACKTKEQLKVGYLFAF